jgi:hypothetical protein
MNHCEGFQPTATGECGCGFARSSALAALPFLLYQVSGRLLLPDIGHSLVIIQLGSIIDASFRLSIPCAAIWQIALCLANCKKWRPDSPSEMDKWISKSKREIAWILLARTIIGSMIVSAADVGVCRHLGGLKKSKKGVA